MADKEKGCCTEETKSDDEESKEGCC